MNLQALRDSFPEYAKDTKINLGNILTTEGAPGLNEKQIWGTALACAYALQNTKLVQALEAEVKDKLSDQERFASQAAASIMAMNNIYYRFTHLAEDPEITKLPAKLRMTVIGRPGVEKVDFELFCLAVSAINGCGACVKSHVKAALEGGISREGVQSAARIASVLTAAKQALFGAQL
jgi:alkyl hydroperoxide reductase subunit D